MERDDCGTKRTIYLVLMRKAGDKDEMYTDGQKAQK